MSESDSSFTASGTGCEQGSPQDQGRRRDGAHTLIVAARASNLARGMKGVYVGGQVAWV